ncbi:uncharacterized protein PAC_11238 [Phialocephala subalpina]|uniref:BTB domain-containing protein n=1 Tax=Phialocephala subalpina TaxID=576137 RepID=A0A1L7X8K7_9HELO|nr:uncharacterized protein PAC_11238 [Phialocephala subalpina]
MGSTAAHEKLKSEFRASNFSITRENKQRKQQRQNFHIYSDKPEQDESELQLLLEIQEAEKRKSNTMASDFGDSTSTIPGSPSNVAHNPIEALQNSLASGKYSDLLINHGLRRWKAHRVIVCSQSSILESMIEEHDNGTNTLNLSDYDYDAVRYLLEYLYGTNYVTQDVEPEFGLFDHIRVFNLGVSLQISGLINLSVLKFRHNLNNYVDSPLLFFSVVREIYTTQPQPSPLTPPVRRFQVFPSFNQNERERERVNVPTNPGLRLAVLEAGVAEMRKLLSGEYREEFLDLTGEVTDFQAEMYLLMLENPNRPLEMRVEEKVLCENCGPRPVGDGYLVETECKSCGEPRALAFN